MAVFEQRLYYATGSAETEKCMVEVDLPELTSRQVYCADTGWVVGDVKPSRDGIVLTELRLDGDRCKRLVVIPDDSDTPQPMAPSVAECGQWSGNLIGDTVAWNEIDGQDPEIGIGAPAYASTGGDEPVELGQTDTESIITCGDWFYWRYSETIDRQRYDQVRRWRPGSPIEVIYRPPVDDVVLGALTCIGENHIAFPQNVMDEGRWVDQLLAGSPNP